MRGLHWSSIKHMGLDELDRHLQERGIPLDAVIDPWCQSLIYLFKMSQRKKKQEQRRQLAQNPQMEKLCNVLLVRREQLLEQAREAAEETLY